MSEMVCLCGVLFGLPPVLEEERERMNLNISNKIAPVIDWGVNFRVLSVSV